MKTLSRFVLPLLCFVFLSACSGNQDIDPNDPDNQLNGKVESLSVPYYHKMLAMEFTSIHCTYCPILAEAVENVQKSYPERIIPIAFHSDRMGEDPMFLTLNDKIYDKVATGEGLPMFAFDFRKSSQHIVNEYAKIVSELEYQLKTYKPSCGVAVETSFDENTRKLSVTAKFTSNDEASYRYHIFLVEDGIEGVQAGHEGSYIHNNVLRKMSADNILGTRLNQGNPLSPGKECTVTKTFDIPSEWNHDNMRVIASIMSSKDGSTYSCDNSNECVSGSSADYSYEKE